MTKIQEVTQCDGPWRPTVRQLVRLLSEFPHHIEVRAVSIRGQGGGIVVEYYHEGLDMVREFTPEEYEGKEL